MAGPFGWDVLVKQSDGTLGGFHKPIYALRQALTLCAKLLCLKKLLKSSALSVKLFCAQLLPFMKSTPGCKWSRHWTRPICQSHFDYIISWIHLFGNNQERCASNTWMIKVTWWRPMSTWRTKRKCWSRMLRITSGFTLLHHRWRIALQINLQERLKTIPGNSSICFSILFSSSHLPLYVRQPHSF